MNFSHGFTRPNMTLTHETLLFLCLMLFACFHPHFNPMNKKNSSPLVKLPEALRISFVLQMKANPYESRGAWYPFGVEQVRGLNVRISSEINELIMVKRRNNKAKACLWSGRTKTQNKKTRKWVVSCQCTSTFTSGVNASQKKERPFEWQLARRKQAMHMSCTKIVSLERAHHKMHKHAHTNTSFQTASTNSRVMKNCCKRNASQHEHSLSRPTSKRNATSHYNLYTKEGSR